MLERHAVWWFGGRCATMSAARCRTATSRSRSTTMEPAPTPGRPRRAIPPRCRCRSRRDAAPARGPPGARDPHVAPDEYVVDTDAVGSFCVQTSLPIERGTLKLRFAGSSLYDATSAEVPFDLTRPSVALVFDPEPSIASLDRPVFSVGLRVTAPGIAKEGWRVVLRDENERVLGNGPGRSGRARSRRRAHRSARASRSGTAIGIARRRDSLCSADLARHRTACAGRVGRRHARSARRSRGRHLDRSRGPIVAGPGADRIRRSDRSRSLGRGLAGANRPRGATGNLCARRVISLPRLQFATCPTRLGGSRARPSR